MFCKNCGAQIDDNAYACVHCGVKTDAVSNTSNEDKGGALWWLLGFFIPLAGLIIWALCKDSTPKNAKSAGVGALVGAITSIVLAILIFVVYFVFIFAIIGGSIML